MCCAIYVGIQPPKCGPIAVEISILCLSWLQLQPYVCASICIIADFFLQMPFFRNERKHPDNAGRHLL